MTLQGFKNRHLNKKITYSLIILAAFFMAASLRSNPVYAVNPNIISFQGKVVNADGTNVTNGAYNFDFIMWDDPTVGTNRWQELTKSVTVTNGVFQTNLGSATTLPDFNAFPNLYLAIRFNADVNGYMTPRIQMASVPYALNADKVGGVAASSIVQLGATQSGNINIGSGTLTSGAINGQTISSTANFTGTLAVGGASALTLGTSSTNDGAIIFKSSGGVNTVTLQSPTTNPTASYALKLPTTAPALSQCLQNDGTTIGQLTFAACSAAAGDNISVNGSAATDANFLDTTATGTVAGVTFTLATIPNPDTIALTVSVASGTIAGVVTNGAQTLGGDKTFTGNTTFGGTLTVNTADSSVVRTSFSDFALGTIGASLSNTINPSGQLELSDGTIPNASKGTITTGGATLSVATGTLGAGALSITRPDGKYYVMMGGSATTANCVTAGTAQNVYDTVAGTFTAGAAGKCATAALAAGSLAIPRPGGLYLVIHGGGVATSTIIDPTETINSVAGSTVAVTAPVSTFAAGTVAFKRADGRYLITAGGTAGATQIYDPVANTFAVGPTNSGGVTWGAGALALPRPDGTALIVNGGAAGTTQVYNPNSGTANLGAFSVGPVLGVGCEINNAGSSALRRADGKYVVLSKATASAIYDPVANTFTCSTSTGPAVALGDGGHAIPLQNGTFLVIHGGGALTSSIYDPSANSYTAQGTSLTTVTTGAHSIMRPEGTWQIIVGGSNSTNNYDTGLPMTGTTTRYTSDDISTTSLNVSSTLKWTSQYEAVYAAARNAATNTAFSAIQFFVRTAVNSGGCTTPLNAATDREIGLSGDFIRPGSTDNCIRITVQFNRPLPKRITDDRGTWQGNGNTVLRLDYATPTLFDIAIDNSTVLHRDNFGFSSPNTQGFNNGVVPTTQLTAGAPTAGGSCTAGAHFWFYSFVANGSESRLAPVSATQTCGANATVPLSAVAVGPSGTTSRKIYRTVAGALATDTPFLLTTLADNSTTVFSDTIADGSLGTAFAQTEASGPISTRTEAVNGMLTLPYGRLNQTAPQGTSGFYQGLISGSHPALNQAQTIDGTFVIARPNKTFIVIAALSVPAANASIYDPATQTFTAQSGTGIPTAANGAGGFALKRPDGKFLVVLGNNTSTTNIYDPDLNIFYAGPALSGLAGNGAMMLQNTDGSITIVHGNALTTTTIFDPIRNTMISGPASPTTAFNCGAMAIPRPAINQYLVFFGAASGVIGPTTTSFYDAQSKIFTATASAPTLTATQATGCGAFTFQRQDGVWVIVEGGGGTAGATQTATMVYDPRQGQTTNLQIGFPLPVGTLRGGHVIPRADGTFLIVNGNASTGTQIYVPYGGTTAPTAGIPLGVFLSAGPVLPTATGAGSLSFQRPDGKWVIINGNTTQTTMLYDAGWYAEGQYLSEQTQVPALSANSVLNWRQTADNFVRMEARTASSQAALSTTSYTSIGRPGASIGNAGGETWVQIEINMRRDFPTFGGPLTGVYTSTGGMAYSYRNITTPSVISYDINNGSDLLTLQTNGLNVFRVSSEGNIYTSGSGAFHAGGADLAENYTSTESLTAGEVVQIDPNSSNSVKRTTGQYQTSILGVVSTAPGFVAGAFTENSHPVALVGRVPVKISSENGIVRSGDFLTSSSIPGYAMKATVSGRVIGTALDSFEAAAATACPAEGAGNVSATKCGSVMMFVNLTDYQGASLAALMADDTSDAVIPNLSFPSINGINGVSEDWSEQGRILGFLQSLKAKQNSGQAAKGTDILTSNVYASNQVISPTIVADLIRAKTIKADHIEGLEIYTNKLTSLSNEYAGLQAQVNQGTSSQTPAVGLSQVSFSSGTFSVSLLSLGSIESRGGLTVGGDAKFNGKSIFLGLAQFMNDIEVSGRVTFNKDSGGYAKIAKDATRVDVIFSKEYAQQPVVSVSLTADQVTLADGTKEDIKIKEQRLFATGYNYLVSNLTTKGFTIVLNKKATEDLKFTWNGVAIKDGEQITGQPDPSDTTL